MTTTFTSNTLQGTYNDDYNVDKHFHQILFNSGRALQARELTQLQTLIYKEISRLGRNVFKEGAAVSSGGMSINSSLEYVKIASTNQGGAFADIPIGTVFQDTVTGISAKVIQVQIQATSAGFDTNTLYIQYIDDSLEAIGSSPSRFGDGVTLNDISGTGYELVTKGTDASGRGTRLDVETGDFFVLGRFVNASKQSIILSPYTQSFTGTVGFKVDQDVVTIADDTSLYDNTGGVTNTAAPGADRYRITLTLTDKADLSTDDTFVFLANIENSTIVEGIDETDAYNKINDLLALRTNEESGDYIVNPYSIHFEDAVANDSSLELIVSSGMAYVNGYRVENPTPVKLQVPRPQKTDTIVSDVVPVEYGNYFLIKSGKLVPDITGAGSNDGFVLLSKNATNPSNDTIGRCRVRHIEKRADLELGATHRVYVENIFIDDGESIKDIQTIGLTSNNNLVVARTPQNGTLLYGTQRNDLLMPTARPRLESISDITLTVQRQVTVALGGTPVATADISSELVSADNEQFVDGTNWIVSTVSNFDITHDVDTSTGVISNFNGTNDTLSGDLLVTYYVQKTGSIATKTKVDDITDTLYRIDSDNVSYYKFAHVDVYEVDSARRFTSSGSNILPSMIFDDGQRDNLYRRSRLILDGEDSAPGKIYVKYSRLQHNGDGDFFAASSYNTLGYSNIPTHVTADGTEVSLFNYLDFRSDFIDRDSASQLGTISNIKYLPKSGDNVTADVSYYLPRSDKLILTQEGDVQLLMGQQAEFPQFKATPENALDLFKITLNPNTLDETDLAFVPVEHKHYTMKDIAGLEAKLDRLEEYTRLNIAELRAFHEPSLDSAGNERVVVGSQTDDGSDQTGSDTENDDYGSSLDPESGVFQPMLDEDNVRLIYDGSLSSGVVKKGDNVYLTHTDEQWAFQELASTSVKVNPTGNSPFLGSIRLSPSSDDWKDSKTPATRTVENNRNRLDTKQAFLWNNWQWNWLGRVARGNGPEYQSTRTYDDRYQSIKEQYSTYPRETGTPRHVSRVVSSETIRHQMGDRYKDVALTPWIRSRKIYFHAKGLRPNTKFTPFFDGKDVSAFCREETTFKTWSDNTTVTIYENAGNRYGIDLNEHPEGSTELTTDANGEVIGSFFIPSNRAQSVYRRLNKADKQYPFTENRFRAGVREFQLLDINTPDWAQAGSKAFAYYVAWGGPFRFWNRWKWLRYPESVVPFSYLMNRYNTFSPKEVKDVLDKIASGDINLVDPKLAGKYGTNQAGLTAAELTTIDNDNTMSGVLSDYITLDQNRQSGGVVGPLMPAENPLAQSFYVDNPYGLVLTKVDLFFRAKDTGNLPISLTIRPVENGKPSANTVVPDSYVYKKASEITITSGSPTLSVIQGNETTFEFEEPVYLQPWTHYAICLQSASTEYEVYAAKTTENVYGSTSRTVSTQPIPGELFLPQSSTNYVGSKDTDLMFKLTRAKFSLGGGSLILTNIDLPSKELVADPIYTSLNKNFIAIRHEGHGLDVGDEITISGVEGNSGSNLNGIPISEINATHTILSKSLKSVGVQVSTAATATGFAGGTGVLNVENRTFSVANLSMENNIPKQTSLDVSAKFTTGKYVSGTTTRFTLDPQYRRITPNENIDFAKPKAIYNPTIEAGELTSNGNGGKSLFVKADFKTSNDYVSPIVDLQRASLIVAGYMMDDSDTPDLVNNVSETSPVGATGGSRHITAPVTVLEPARAIDVRADLSVPEGAGVDFYFRTAGADEDITQKPWIYQAPLNDLSVRNDGVFERQQWLAGGLGGTLDPFYKGQGKFVMKGQDNPIRVRDMNFKFLAK